MQFRGLYKKRKPLQIGGRKIEWKYKNYIGKPCIWKLELNANIGSSAKSDEVLSKSEEVLIPSLALYDRFVEFFSSQT